MSTRQDKAPRRLGRRIFLIGAAVVGGGMALGVGLLSAKLSRDKAFRLPATREGDASFGAWLTIGRDGVVTVAVPNQEMGQGIYTTIPMLVAEELGVAPQALRPVAAPVAAVYANPVAILNGLPFHPHDQGLGAQAARWTAEKVLRAVGIMVTGGSTSTRNAWMAAREAGAAAREMLRAAAAKAWSVPAAEITLAQGVLAHAGSGKSAPIGEFVDAAAQIEPPSYPRLKERNEYTLIGRGIPRLDVPAKVDGSAQFGIDVVLPGMRHAAIAHSPVVGGRVRSASLPEGLPGKPALVDGGDFVAVVADGWWAASQALAKAVVEWDDGPNAGFSSAAMIADLRKAAAGQLPSAAMRDYETRGDFEAALANGVRKLEAEYSVPYLAHATMEPMNCTALVKDGRCDIWAGHQAPTLVQWMGGKRAGIESDAITVHIPYLGGGFGRRAELDFVQEAVFIASKFPGTPVKTVWSREEDMRHDRYRPAMAARLTAALTPGKGEFEALGVTIAGPSLSRQFAGRLSPSFAADSPDKTNVEGATWLPYALPALRVRHALVPTPLPCGYWRSVGHSANAFFVESFLDECAFEAKQDPYAYRRALLFGQGAGPDAARAANVLDTVAAASGWRNLEGRGTPAAPLVTPPKPKVLPEGVRGGRGIAYAESFGSHVAQVVEVEVDADDRIRVTRVVAAVDCGTAIDPAIAKAQVAGAIVFALAAALGGRIDVEKGRVVQSNFGDYPMPVLADMPEIDVRIVDSGAELGGIGEVGVPPLAPALANAVFSATGKRLRELPLKLA